MLLISLYPGLVITWASLGTSVPLDYEDSSCGESQRGDLLDSGWRQVRGSLPLGWLQKLGETFAY